MFVAIKATSLNARASASKSKLVKVKRREDDTKYVAKTIAAIVIHYILCTWCVQRARPLFCAIFKPVRIIFTVLMGTIFLGDDFHLGREKTLKRRRQREGFRTLRSHAIMFLCY